MTDQIQKIAEKFWKDENLSQQKSLLLGSIGLSRVNGLISGLAYDVHFSQHPYSEERQNQLTEYLGEALLNWHLLALASGVDADEICKRFSASWEAKRSISQNQASIKDLLKHLKPSAKHQESTTQQQQINRKDPELELTH